MQSASTNASLTRYHDGGALQEVSAEISETLASTTTSTTTDKFRITRDNTGLVKAYLGVTELLSKIWTDTITSIYIEIVANVGSSTVVEITNFLATDKGDGSGDPIYIPIEGQSCT